VVVNGFYSKLGAVLACCLLAVSLMFAAHPAFAKDKSIKTKQGTIKVETVAKDLDHPWSLAFLPDGRILVTERPGRLRIVAKDGAISEPLKASIGRRLPARRSSPPATAR
jgi:glucose/arabinose dehydrogenase